MFARLIKRFCKCRHREVEEFKPEWHLGFGKIKDGSVYIVCKKCGKVLREKEVE